MDARTLAMCLKSLDSIRQAMGLSAVYYDTPEKIADAVKTRILYWLEKSQESHSWIKITDDPQTLPEPNVKLWIAFLSPWSGNLMVEYGEFISGEGFHNLSGGAWLHEDAKFWQYANVPALPPES